MNPAGEPDESSIRKALQAGMEHRDAGRLAQAEAIYRRVLEAVPGRTDALVLLGDVAHRMGRKEEAIDLLRHAIRIAPAVAAFHNRLGLVLEDCGRPAEAEAAYRRAVQCDAKLAPAWFHLGNALAAQGRREQAVAAYRRALACAPGYAEAHNNLAVALAAEGRIDEALAGYRAAVAIDDRPVFRANFARCLPFARRLPADAGMRALVARALSEAWIRPADLARTAIALIRGDPRLDGPIDRAVRAWPARPDAAALFGTSGLGALSREPLVAALLGNAHACDRDLERFLTSARHALLAAALEPQAASGGMGEEGLAFACALARQCFLNDYVFSCTAEESARVRSLEERVTRAIERGEDVPASWLALLASYVPLGSLACAARLPDRPWPEPVRDLLVQQIAEPAMERELRAAIPRWTEIAGDVSRRVQRQYEENPYPRWTAVPAAEPLPLDAYLRQLFPRAPLPPPGRIADREILVAGCGTGQESVDLGRQFPHARLAAVDLSMASLGYASRKTREAGLANVEYAQADIAALAPTGRSFDVISCVGVLHHLADPLAGWRRLVALLRPGGFMQAGLYSETGRRDIAAARARIAERGYEANPEGIRRCRRELLDSPDGARLASLRDLYGMNECRDLLFHEQEHRFTLPQVRSMLEALGLQFIGFAVQPDVASRFAQRFPGDASLADLDRWHAFETEFPDTFAGMYLFWVRKPEAS